jgi:hypothetical protein
MFESLFLSWCSGRRFAHTQLTTIVDHDRWHSFEPQHFNLRNGTLPLARSDEIEKSLIPRSSTYFTNPTSHMHYVQRREDPLYPSTAAIRAATKDPNIL